MLIKKIIQRYLLFLFYLLSLLTPRNKNKWVFGSLEGFGGNARYLYLHIRNQRKDINAVWLTKSKSLYKIMQNKGVDNFCYFYSIKGLYHLLTAGLYVTTHELSRSLTIWTLGRAKWLNLWHGVGIKALRFNSTVGRLGQIYRHRWLRWLLYPYGMHLFYKPDFFVSTSALMHQHFQHAFDLSDKAIVSSGYPRCFAMLNSDPTALGPLFHTLNQYQHVYIYMPTWRKGGATELLLDFKKLQQFLEETNRVFILKLHPLVAKSLNFDTDQYPNIINISNSIDIDIGIDIDIYQLLPYTHTLITDYSSVYYDYLLMKDKYILLYPYDYEEYITASRDLSFDYNNYTPGVRAYNFDQLLFALKNNHLSSTNSKEMIKIKNLFWDYDITSNQCLVSLIESRL